MAKSIRSKRKRKLRAIKRVRYSVKELDRLKKTLQNDPVRSKKALATLIGTVSSSERTAASDTQETSAQAGKQESVTPKRKYNRKTMQDEHGNYPVWMNQRKRNKMKAKSQRNKSRRKKVN